MNNKDYIGVYRTYQKDSLHKAVFEWSGHHWLAQFLRGVHAEEIANTVRETKCQGCRFQRAICSQAQAVHKPLFGYFRVVATSKQNIFVAESGAACTKVART